ncbi:hypothetical protein IGI04_002107 [Brassica rapa subsp. trilocularis]|uniref:glycerophosphodiester phosphodiesterase n=1 Tax=Brassica rapa subsp. trilocularis TaxID=1813537 RepID=A0ABQ7NUJ6_BRACM|nr:hypothetical protein IGI04_002107 [Brassica rapa subsp. trilocularis]
MGKLEGAALSISGTLRRSPNESPLRNRSSSVPEISSVSGTYTFSITWSEIQSLTPYLREKQGLDVVKAVLDTLTETGYSNSITTKLKKPPASAVVIGKSSVFPEIDGFVTGQTNVVERLQKSQLPVYVELFQNEFVSQPFDFFSDATIEINSYVTGPGINGIMTEFPFKAERYRKVRNRCLASKETLPYMAPVQPGGLLEVVSPGSLPPDEAPTPVFTDADVTGPPLPPVTSTTAPAPSGQA